MEPNTTHCCAATASGSPRRLGFINIAADELVRSIYYNHVRREVLVASLHSQDDYESLRCAGGLRAVPWA